ncbi:hypothetical protein COLO4_25463 [Corchorus olitorius]|uniref:Uncharacterized protein n=1 Tax=Corchorus olitorius TaxID=93759 RepID=A0A1R3I2D3_9ROSI|nr:hypothetical protein COLO4_25463 [Corchorus olitorius]
MRASECEDPGNESEKRPNEGECGMVVVVERLCSVIVKDV